MYRWWSMRNEEACTLTVEGEDVFEDVVLDVADHAARDGAIGIEERGVAEQRLELGVTSDELQPHLLGVVEESELRKSVRSATCAPQAAAAHTHTRGECSLECLCGSGGGSPACPGATVSRRRGHKMRGRK